MTFLFAYLIVAAAIYAILVGLTIHASSLGADVHRGNALHPDRYTSLEIAFIFVFAAGLWPVFVPVILFELGRKRL